MKNINEDPSEGIPIKFWNRELQISFGYFFTLRAIIIINLTGVITKLQSH